MNELQGRLVEILDWFHALCEQHGLVYFAQCGTVIGAVRHNGFIPWDDDIDVGMPRRDYEKLRELSKKIGDDSRFRIEFPGAKDYAYPFCKIYDAQTTLVENNRDRTKRGIFIDVFPVDGIGNTLEESEKNLSRMRVFLNMFSLRRLAVTAERSFLKNMMVRVLWLIPDWFASHEKLEKMCKRLDYDACKYVVSSYGAWGKREIMQKDWVEDPILWKFENTQIYIPRQYHQYLTKVYGDYMKLPPEEKRVSHHSHLLLDLNKSYLEE